MSQVHKYNGSPFNLSWEDIAVQTYNDDLIGVTKQVPIGDADGSTHFTIRYFRLDPGTHSNLEKHPHEHGVVVMHGQARLQLNDEFYDVALFDSIFISGNVLHQFVQRGAEPFGFFCVIKAKILEG